MENKLLMAHQVAGYPEDETAITAAEALIAGGTGILEVQLAFSDPSADGVAIQTACSTVLSKGYTVKQGLEYISKIRKEKKSCPPQKYCLWFQVRHKPTQQAQKPY